MITRVNPVRKMTNPISIVDFHAHIIPHADHGSNSTETSLAQLSLARDAGVSRIIATPHFYPEEHSMSRFLETRNSGYLHLVHRTESDMPEIRLGAEVLACAGIERLPGLEKLFIYGTNTLLLELPFANFQHEYCDSVYALARDGVDVIIAHADRYHPDNIERLIDNGARIQLNADSLCKFFKAKRLYDWMDRGLVVALGSDIHKADKAAYKRFATAISKVEPYIDYIKCESDKIWNNAKVYE
jgi:protein-tyrosine phosphatase